MDTISTKNFLNPSMHCFTDARAQKRCQGMSTMVLWSLKVDLVRRRMIKRLEDLGHNSGAVKSHLGSQMKELNNLVAELVNFGISVSYYHEALRIFSLLIFIACTKSYASSEGRSFVEDFIPTDDDSWNCQILCSVNSCEGHEARQLNVGSDWKRCWPSYRREQQTLAPVVGDRERSEK